MLRLTAVAVLGLVVLEGKTAAAIGVSVTDAVFADGRTARFLHISNRPWPFNGVVTNRWDRPIVAWSDTRGRFLVPAGESTPFDEDVDYVEVGGQWYKIGVNHTVVDSAGQVTSFACRAMAPGGACE